MTFEATTASVSIDRKATEVYAYVSDPQHFPEWAPGFVLAVQPTDKANTWNVETVAGKASIRFVEKNAYGIVDHYVQLETGPEVYSPMRVLENNKGAQVIFTVYRLPGMTDGQHTEDVKMVQSDLNQLKAVLEKQKH